MSQGLLAKTISKDNFAGHSARKKKKKVARRRDGYTLLKNGQRWTLLAQLRQPKTGIHVCGKGLL